jgi:hypothetical protein
MFLKKQIENNFESRHKWYNPIWVVVAPLERKREENKLESMKFRLELIELGYPVDLYTIHYTQLLHSRRGVTRGNERKKK